MSEQQVPDERVRSIRLRRTEIRILAVLAGLGLVLGGLLGWLQQDRFSAAALADASPGVTVTDALDISPDIANRYVQTELVYLDIDQPQISAAAAAAGLTNSPKVAARQVGTTNIIEIRGSGSTRERAADLANVALDAYIEDWRARTLDESQRLLENVTGRITTTKQQIADLGNTAADAAQARGLTSELSRLTTEQSDLEYRIGGIKTANRVVLRADAASATTVSSVVQFAGLGLLLGVALGLALIVWRRSRTHTHSQT